MSGPASGEASKLSALLAGSRFARVRAVRELESSPELAFALRRVVFTDGDAEVRAAAVQRLAELASAGAGEVEVAAGALEVWRLEAWLLDALGDRSPLVRDAIVRALARVGGEASLAALRELVARDGLWWVRRGAVYALAAVGGAAELPALTGALADPFWRVRHAAVKALAVLGARDPELRDELVDAPASEALTFLRASWGPVAIEAPARAASPSRLPAALLDPDPAVVAARLAELDCDPIALVELLCDPHVPLRDLAVHKLAASGDRAAYAAALDWLEEPRIPHVVDTVVGLLDRLGDPAAELAEQALARADRPGAARWAIGWVVATHFESLYPAALERARRGGVELRRAALRLASDRELVSWAEPRLVDDIAVELHERRRPAAHDALLALDPATPRTRALQLDARARRGDWAPVEAALADPHHGPRAIAARWLVRRGGIDIAALAADPDPSVREAALVPETAAAAFWRDRDPWVRRAALRVISGAWRGARELPPELAALARAALSDEDPALRAQACGLPLADDGALALVLARLGDREEMVRAAAHDAIEQLPQAELRIERLIERMIERMRDRGAAESEVRAQAYGYLLRALDDAAIARARAALELEQAPEVRAVLAAVAGIAGEASVVAPARVESVEPLARPATAGTGIERHPIERRPFGRAGFDVAPLAISGAYDVAPRALAAADEAGVDLYFWEPGYDVLTRFLRTRARRGRTRVITGSYHADAASIRADVDRALRTLRRDALDAFLLFWTRSPARVDEQAFAVLDELRRAGKIRAVGFSTHERALARDAIARSPWDVVMIRHSAAHPGIEAELLPAARERGTAIVTFSALTYGRMIAGPGAPSPADCYRYSLSQPGVTACISAPRRTHELLENLDVLARPTLSADQLAALRAHGSRVHAESQRFNTLVRQPTRDAAAAARELLAAELPPSDAASSDASASASAPSRMPQASRAKRSRTRLGGRAR